VCIALVEVGRAAAMAGAVLRAAPHPYPHLHYGLCILQRKGVGLRLGLQAGLGQGGHQEAHIPGPRCGILDDELDAVLLWAPQETRGIRAGPPTALLVSRVGEHVTLI
jgi:hypothetical protein